MSSFTLLMYISNIFGSRRFSFWGVLLLGLGGGGGGGVGRGGQKLLRKDLLLIICIYMYIYDI